uniref:Uncharacterized protein n=1 Tax=Physcomitrium patens TaxID=3218 RepID=A0A2K1K848_PHYPA|nr:hypothetical protein PHYPA_011852 [Physcomitrium patens]
MGRTNLKMRSFLTRMCRKLKVRRAEVPFEGPSKEPQRAGRSEATSEAIPHGDQRFEGLQLAS